MISKLAKSSIEQLKSEGLEPSFEDIVLLNALGLKVENGTESYEFGFVPRCAFLGDMILWEPNISKKIWIDQAKALVGDSLLTQLVFMCYALNTPMNELVDLNNAKTFNETINEFADQVLCFTESQLFAAVSYVMTGNDWRTGEDFTPEQKQDFESIYDIPDNVYCSSKYLLAKALYSGLPQGVEQFTAKELERMLIVAAIHKGNSDILKNEHTQNAGKYYACYGSIRKRLIEEQQSCREQNKQG